MIVGDMHWRSAIIIIPAFTFIMVGNPSNNKRVWHQSFLGLTVNFGVPRSNNSRPIFRRAIDCMPLLIVHVSALLASRMQESALHISCSLRSSRIEISRESSPRFQSRSTRALSYRDRFWTRFGLHTGSSVLNLWTPITLPP